MAKQKKAKAEAGESAQPWIISYADMITLMLAFFIVLYNPSDTSGDAQLNALIAYFSNLGLGANNGGSTLSLGKLADMGNNIMSLPSMEKGRALGTALREAISLLNPEIKSNEVRISEDERGIVISLASDAFFKPASATINIEETRDVLMHLASFLYSDEVGNRKIRIEGNTDSEDVDPAGPWQDNWILSANRAWAVLRYLVDFGVDENRFQIAGFGDTMPIASNDTPEGRAENRRVDIVILDDAHL